MSPLSRSVQHRRARRGILPWVWGCEPVVSPYADRLKLAALGDHECRPYVVMVEEAA